MDASQPAPAMHKADWLLRIAILLYALGLTRGLFTRVGSSIGSIALLEFDIDHAHILLGEMIGASLVLLCAFSLLIRPTAVALLVIATLVLTESVAGVRAGGFPFFALNPYAQTLRYLTPLALIPLITTSRFRPSLILRCQLSAWMLRIGIATLFTTHGYEAWRLHPQFIDFIIGSGLTLGGFEISETTASSMLKIIAAIDIIAAALVLLHPSPVLVAWLSFWGLVTALSRPISLGFASYPEVLLRASHVLAPLALACLIAEIARLRRAPRQTATDPPGG
ncbi:MAG: hypothetical protein WED15_09180 [Akkermansiaceae bacterium]